MAHGVTINRAMRSWGRGYQEHGHMARGSHGLPKVSLGHAMPYPSMPCGRSPLKRPYSCFRDGRLQDRWAASVFYLLGFKCIKIHLFKKKIVLDCIKIHLSLNKQECYPTPGAKKLRHDSFRSDMGTDGPTSGRTNGPTNQPT
jgi:hypothetical protein